MAYSDTWFDLVDPAYSGLLGNQWQMAYGAPIPYGYSDPYSLQLSPTGQAFIKDYEVYDISDPPLTAYPDPASGGDPWTIGYGHTAGVYPGMTITGDQAEAFFDEDAAKFVEQVQEAIGVPLTQSQFDTLVSFAFNVKPPGLENVATTLNAGDYAGAINQMGLYVNAAGGYNQGVANRRADEALLWGGNWQAPMVASDVATLQSNLAAMGFDPGPIDGDYGPLTAAAVAQAQAAVGMDPTGLADPATMESIASLAAAEPTINAAAARAPPAPGGIPYFGPPPVSAPQTPPTFAPISLPGSFALAAPTIEAQPATGFPDAATAMGSPAASVPGSLAPPPTFTRSVAPQASPAPPVASTGAYAQPPVDQAASGPLFQTYAQPPPPEPALVAQEVPLPGAPAPLDNSAFMNPEAAPSTRMALGWPAGSPDAPPFGPPSGTAATTAPPPLSAPAAVPEPMFDILPPPLPMPAPPAAGIPTVGAPPVGGIPTVGPPAAPPPAPPASFTPPPMMPPTVAPPAPPPAPPPSFFSPLMSLPGALAGGIGAGLSAMGGMFGPSEPVSVSKVGSGLYQTSLGTMIDVSGDPAAVARQPGGLEALAAAGEEAKRDSGLYGAGGLF